MGVKIQKWHEYPCICQIIFHNLSKARKIVPLVGYEMLSLLYFLTRLGFFSTSQRNDTKPPFRKLLDVQLLCTELASFFSCLNGQFGKKCPSLQPYYHYNAVSKYE